jgi:hypothetical protein
MEASNRKNIDKSIEWYNQHGLGIYSNDPKVQEILNDLSFETLFTFPALTPTYVYRDISEGGED